MRRLLQVFIGGEERDPDLEHEVELLVRQLGAGFYPEKISGANTHRVYRKSHPGMRGQVTELFFKEASDAEKPDYLKTKEEINEQASGEPTLDDDRPKQDEGLSPVP